MLLLACFCTGCTLLAQKPADRSKINDFKRKVTAARQKPDKRLNCDPNFIWSSSTTTPGTYKFEIENPVPGYFYDWDFGDGSTAIGPSDTHVFPGAGSYTVTLQSHNPQFFDTCRESLTLCVSDIPEDCRANFSWTGSTSTPGVYLFDAEDAQPGDKYTWNFGNGATSTGDETVYTYYSTGSYNVCLNAFNEEIKDSCSKCINICVNQVPSCWANFTVQPTGVTNEFYFSAEASTGLEIAAYYWDFGDGNTSDRGPETNYQYSEVGQFTVCLTIVYANNCVGSYCMDVVLREPSTIDELRSLTAAKASNGAVGNATGNDLNIKKTIRATPNPVHGSTVTLNIDATNSGTYRYNIYNAQGEPVITGTKNLAKGVQNITLEVNRLQPGRYWIELVSSKQQLRTGFIKL